MSLLPSITTLKYKEGQHVLLLENGRWWPYTIERQAFIGTLEPYYWVLFRPKEGESVPAHLSQKWVARESHLYTEHERALLLLTQ